MRPNSPKRLPMRPPVLSPPPDFPKSPAKAHEMRYTGPYNRNTRPRPQSRLRPYHTVKILRPATSRSDRTAVRKKMNTAGFSRHRPTSADIGRPVASNRDDIGPKRQRPRNRATLKSACQSKRGMRPGSRLFLPIPPTDAPLQKRKIWRDIWGHLGTYVPLSRQNERASVPIGIPIDIGAARPRFQYGGHAIWRSCKLCDRRKHEPRSICEVEEVGTLGSSGISSSSSRAQRAPRT